MKRKLLLLSLLAALVMPLLLTARVLAATGTWINKDHVVVNGTNYKDLSPGTGSKNFCDTDKGTSTTDADCEKYCHPVIMNISPDFKTADGYLSRDLRRGFPPSYNDCDPGPKTVVNFEESSLPKATGTPTGSGSAQTPVEEEAKSCEELKGFAELGWIICPVVLTMDAGLNWVDTQIQELLRLEEKKYDNDGIKQASSNIRGIAFTILVPVLLVMVIGTALGVTSLDAYTVKKAMPRLVVAVIFISLSYEICVFLIELFNVIGRGMMGLFTSPFGASVDTLSLADLFGGSLFNSIIALPVVASGGIILLLLFGETLLIAGSIALIILILRQIFIVALLLVAPLAIIAWIFPGNDKLWKAWWSLFSKLLIMFPLIMGILATGRIFAFIIMESNGGPNQGSYLDSLLKLGAYMLPYAFIPFTFKFAGGAFATISGVANDRSKGLFDKARKRRGERRERMSAEKFVDPNSRFGKSRLGKYTSKAATWTVSPYGNLAYSARDGVMGRDIPFLTSKGRMIETSLHGKGLEGAEKWVQHVNKHGANDKFYRAVAGLYEGFSDPTKEKLVNSGFAEWKKDETGNVVGIEAKRSLRSFDDFTKMSGILATSDSDSERKAAVALEANAAYTHGLYQNPETMYTDVATGAAWGLASHQFFDPDDSADLGNMLLKEHHGDQGYAHAAVVQAEFIGRQGHPENKPGYGHAVVKDEKTGKAKFVAGTSKAGGRAWAVMETLGPNDFAAAKGDIFRDDRMGDVIKDILNYKRNPAAVEAKWQEEGVKKEDIAKRKATVESKFEVMQDVLLNIAGQWSSAAVDNKVRAREILEATGNGALIERRNAADDGAKATAAQQQGAQQPEGGGGPVKPPDVGGGFNMGGPNL